MRRLLANRRALRLLTLGFAAVAPARPGDPLECRRCGGPLRDPGHAALTRCVYCEAPNVMAADLRFEASLLARFGDLASDPHVLLSTCSRQRRRATVGIAVGLGVALAGVASLAASSTHPAMSPLAVVVPFDGTERLPHGEAVHAASGARRVDLVTTLAETSVSLVRGAHGGVDVIADTSPARILRDAGASRGDEEDLPGAPDGARAWARLPDGALAFAGPGGLGLLAPDGAVTTLLAPAFYRDPIVRDLAAGPAGALLATTRASGDGHWRTRKVDRDGTTHGWLVDCTSPELSPDGARVAATELVADRFQLVIADVSSPGRLAQWTRGSGHVAYPTWSPDGRRLAFLTRSVRDPVHYSQRHGDTQLWVIDLEGHLTPMTTGEPLELVKPVWTSEGIWVVSRRRDADAERWKTALWRVTP